MSKLCTCLCIILFCIQNIVYAGVCEVDNVPGTIEKLRLKVFKRNSTYPTFTESTIPNPRILMKDIVHKDSVLYVHGYLENTDSENVQIIVKAYLENRDVNVLLVDWSKIAIDLNYIYVASQVPTIGKAIAKCLEKLSEKINLNTLHIIGHSLGAHIAGFIGRFLSVHLERITGLDPALPLFYPSTCHIRPTDAEAVVILHTDGGFYGTPIDTGTLDFYANKGISPQPGCPIIIGAELCSHQRSIRLYAESLENPNTFLSHKCFDKIIGIEKSNVKVHFGDSTPKNIHGTYCFDTNAAPPYSKVNFKYLK
ncbi:phospholipase A1 [Ptiloglossa arizonensis]|uniref:phospholipase A1 n=1 Tax=Ptiloglossa arizonensis TaxID=3350558 RepID=UPI003F9FF1E9